MVFVDIKHMNGNEAEQKPLRKILDADITKINVDLEHGLVVEDIFNPTEYLGEIHNTPKVLSPEDETRLINQAQILDEDLWNIRHIEYRENNIQLFTIDDIDKL